MGGESCHGRGAFPAPQKETVQLCNPPPVPFEPLQLVTVGMVDMHGGWPTRPLLLHRRVGIEKRQYDQLVCVCMCMHVLACVHMCAYL